MACPEGGLLYLTASTELDRDLGFLPAFLVVFNDNYSYPVSSALP